MTIRSGLCAVAVGLLVAGCGTSATDTRPGSDTGRAESPAPSTLQIPALPTGPQKTIADYVAENKIIEAPVKRGDADSPTFDFPIPPDWRPAGAQRPDWAYGAVVYDKPADPGDPPFMIAIVSKLTGAVDAAKILEYAPGMLQNLPGYEQKGEVQRGTLSGFDAVAFEASYLRDGTRRYIAQKTVVIPGRDGALFVLQLNADAPMDQGQVIVDAAKVTNAETKITV